MDQAVTNTSIMERLDRIEALTLLSAKSIYDAPEAALFTGYSLNRIHRLTCEKRIPHYKRGNKLYFHREELERWMLDRRVKTTDEIESEAETYAVLGRKGRNRASL